MGLNIYVGWDSREEIAFEVCKQSIIENASIEVDVAPIILDELISEGVYSREIDPLASTEFTYSRFLTPFLNNFSGWALFCDCDFLFLGDVAELLKYKDKNKALYCVHHEYVPKEGTKMDGQKQTLYPRKNWSSFMFFNCEHSSTRKLTKDLVSKETGAFLHRMKWAEDSEIGELPTDWNWLEGWNDKPEKGYPKAVHYTRGGPWFQNYQDVAYADVWKSYAKKIGKK